MRHELLGIVKKLLLALKGEMFSKEILPHFMAAFKALVKSNMTADVLRSLALFITYSLHKYNPTRPLRMKKSNVQLKRQPTLEFSNPPVVKLIGDLKKDELSRQQIGVMVLEMYSELLGVDDPSQMNIKKFAKTVTNKVYYFQKRIQHIDSELMRLGGISGYCIFWQRTIPKSWF